MGGVIIGMGPHKASAAIEVPGGRERVLGGGRYATDRDGYRAMRDAVARWPERVWAAGEAPGSAGIWLSGWSLTGRLSPVCRPSCPRGCGCFLPGRGRTTDVTDAHSIALVAARTPDLAAVTEDGAVAALRLLAGRHDELAAHRVQTVTRLHRLLLELVPGGAPVFLSALQAKSLLATVRPRDVAGRTRRAMAAGLREPSPQRAAS
jgi:transposase